MANPQLEAGALAKPVRGEKLLGSRDRRATRTKRDQTIMQQALKRDGRQCRRPKCPNRSKALPIDPCHMRHRGIGGDPQGTRTTLETIVSLCRFDHGEYDAGHLDIRPVHPTHGANSTLDFYDRDGTYLGASDPR